MKSTLWSVTFVFCIALAGAMACSQNSSDAKEGETSASSTDTKSMELAQSDDVAQNAPSAAEDATAAAAWSQLRRQLNEIQKSATTRQKMMMAINQAESLLTGFIDKYPDSPEATDARFELGTLYYSIGRTEEAAFHLAKYVEDGADREKKAFATYYLAEAYKAADRFDDAEAQYRSIVDHYADVNPQLTGMAKAMLADLPTLRRLKVGGTPIPINTKDLNGNPFSLDDLKGKVVLLDFWATWCKPCIAEMPNVVKIYNKYHKEGFEIVGVSLDSSRPALETYIKQNEVPWRQLFDGKGWRSEIPGAYKVKSIPMTYLIDRNGKIRYSSIRGPQLEEAVAQLLKDT